MTTTPPTTKYVFANIKMPIQFIEENNDYKVLDDYLTMEFEVCNELPAKTKFKNKDIIKSIRGLLNPNDKTKPEKENEDDGVDVRHQDVHHQDVSHQDVHHQDVHHFIRKDEPRPPKNRMNITFRKKPQGNVQIYTRKNYGV